jgi:hypothetical protein
MSNYTLIHAGSKVVGKVVGETFQKTIHGSKHFLRTPPAIALDFQSLIEAEKAGARKIQIFDLESQKTYHASIEHIRRVGFELNRGFGKQLALSLDEWIVTRVGGLYGEQLNLFYKDN